jgi:hypothetical protein
MYVIKGQANKIALTLSEKATTNDCEWLIELKGDQTGYSKIFAVTDISEYRERSNIFYITESETENLSHGVVSLVEGQHSYTVYEMAPSSPRNLNTNDSLGIVETGRALVYDPTANEIVNFDEDENKNNAVFE